MASEPPKPSLPHFDLAATGDKDGNPVSVWGFRESCQKCLDSHQIWEGGPCHWRPTAHDSSDAPNQKMISKTCFNGFDENNNFKNGSTHEKDACKTAYFSNQGVQMGVEKPEKARATSDFDQWTNKFLLN